MRAVRPRQCKPTSLKIDGSTVRRSQPVQYGGSIVLTVAPALSFVRISSLWLLLTAAFGVAPAYSHDIAELYRTQAIVTGTGEENRQLGFEECFRDVLVKTSGDQRVLGDARVAAALPDAASFVESFRYRDRLEGIPIHDEQGTHDRPHDLYCHFDRGKVDAFLSSVGRKPWLDERPRMTLFLSVQNARHRFVLARDGDESPYMRDSLLAAAAPLALQIDVPDQATLDGFSIAFDTVASRQPGTLLDATRLSGGDVALAGSLLWSDAELGWIANWRLIAAGTQTTWQIRGVSFDDAFRNAAAGALQILSGNGRPD
jgi:hypothetical protein